MSDLLSTAAQALGAPDSIVKRSAEARAKATGASVDDILTAWTGGVDIPAVAPAAPAESPPTAAAPTGPTPGPAPSTVAPSTVAPSAAATSTAATSTAATSVLVTDPFEEIVEPIAPAPLADRIHRSSRVGALAGLLVGVLLPLVGSPWLVTRAVVVGDPGALRPAVEVFPGWVVLATAALWAVAGALVAGVARAVTGWYGRGMRLATSPSRSAFAGGGAGAVWGALVGGVIVGMGSPSEIVEGASVVPVFGGIVWSILGGLAGGALVGVLVQVLGVPVGVVGAEASEAEEVGGRLGGAVGLPVLALITMLLVVGPLAYLFISFPEWAPLLAIVVAASILGFAGLSASRPGMRVTGTQLIVAVLGIGVVVVTLVAVLVARGDTGAAGDGAEPAAAVARV